MVGNPARHSQYRSTGCFPSSNETQPITFLPANSESEYLLLSAHPLPEMLRPLKTTSLSLYFSYIHTLSLFSLLSILPLKYINMHIVCTLKDTSAQSLSKLLLTPDACLQTSVKYFYTVPQYRTGKGLSSLAWQDFWQSQPAAPYRPNPCCCSFLLLWGSQAACLPLTVGQAGQGGGGCREAPGIEDPLETGT